MELKKGKRSLRTKILNATLLALLILSVSLGSLSGAAVSRLAKQDSSQLMTKICGEEALRFDNKLSLVSHSVEMIYEYACMLDEHSEYVTYTDKYTEAVKDLALSIAGKTDGAMAVYFRYNPQTVGSGTAGFFWSKKQAEDKFAEELPTDILAYNASDIEHVGWFYEPARRGEPMWMAPYYNRNIDVSMISYVIPFYLKTGEFVGVIGMDIDFNSIMTAAGNIQLYNTGKVAMVNLTERLLYSSDSSGRIREERLSTKLYNHVTTINKSTDILEMIDENDVLNLSCCERLSNGMMLFVSVPKKEVYANRDVLIVLLTLMTVLTMAVTFIILRRYTSQIIRPVRKLAEVTQKYADGNWNESYICETGDEIQELSESISVMARKTQSYIDRIKNIATTDALTGVGNTTAYVRYVDQLKENLNGKFNEYSVTIMDLNLLKRANDSYGHDAGDALIREASRYICNSFVHSAVFRVGGDEFTVISFGEDHINIADRCREFERGMNYPVHDAHDIPLSIAYGTASCPADSPEFERLLKLADKKMYGKKKEMKMGRTA